MSCSCCGKPTVIIDCDEGGLGSIPEDTRYHNEDTEWAIPPDHFGDPGVLTCKPNTLPASRCRETKRFCDELAKEAKKDWDSYSPDEDLETF